MKKKKVQAFKEQQFIIPQISSGYDGLKTKKDAFSKSSAVSPFFGKNVRDEHFTKESKIRPDASKAYDIFRSKEERLMKDEDLINKYGTKFPEFKGLSKEKRQEVLGISDYSNKEERLKDRFLEKFQEKPEIKFNFDNVLEDTEEELDETFLEQDSCDLSFEEVEEEEIQKEDVTYKRYHTSSDTYTLPPLDIFEKSREKSLEAPKWLLEKKEIINTTLKDFNIIGEVVNHIVGPAFTRYEIKLDPGIKVSKVSGLYENFQMNLGVKTIRILAPIPGKNTVGIEVPNGGIRAVLFGDLVTEEYQFNNKPLQILFGQDIEGNAIYSDIEDMPHGLIAGATKSGKSVCINTLLICLLLKNRPEQLRLILIDPKKVELSFYNGLPHLITPVITDSTCAAKALEWAVMEMEDRYDLLSRAGVRNIVSYNKKAEDSSNDYLPLPYIVIVIDELADLMMSSDLNVENSIMRICQKARAAGIHLIIATQRPTVQVVSGNIKANIPTRIAFRVTSSTDSNVILDEVGAENLLGNGDMLIKSEDTPIRVQGPLVEDSEISDLCDFIRDRSETNYLFTHDDLLATVDSENKKSEEPEGFIYDVARFCILNNSTSQNSVQNQFRLGFARAKRIFKILEDRGILTRKMGGDNSREVAITMDELNKMFGRS